MRLCHVGIPIIRRRVDREIRIHSRLSHPNIVKLHTWFEDERGIYLVLELLPKDLYRFEGETAAA